MDNVIQNININDIIPMDNSVNEKEINDLVDSVKKYGIIEPLLVRPFNGKYEIVLGNKLYQAAKKAGITILPAIIKSIDDNIINEYKAISNMTQEEKTVLPNNNQNTSPTNKSEFNSDIVNLSELSKEEYEREDVKMNNELNNNVMNDSIGANVANQGAEPTFGGKFFPSLEDEPTNMNMGGLNSNPNIGPAPMPQQNLIDLTDSNENAPLPPMDNLTSPMTPEPTSNMGMPSPAPIDSFSPNIGIGEPIPNQGMPTPEPTPMPNPGMDNTLNIGNISAGYDAAPQMDNYNPDMNMTNLNMGVPSPEPASELPQFDMSQTIDPNPMMSPDIGLGNNNNNVDPLATPEPQYNPTQDMNQQISNPSFEMPSPMNNIEPMNPNIGAPNMNTSPLPPINDFGANMNIGEPMSNPEMPTLEPTPMPNPGIDNGYIAQAPTTNDMKDVVPVANTIKGLVNNLEAFGYKINVIDEELPNAYKITIEIEK